MQDCSSSIALWFFKHYGILFRGYISFPLLFENADAGSPGLRRMSLTSLGTREAWREEEEGLGSTGLHGCRNLWLRG